MKFFIVFLSLFLHTNTKELKTSDGGEIKYYHTNCYGSDGSDCDIIIEKYEGGQLVWKTKIGGNSWDYVEYVLEVEDGYLVLGNTGSYGKGNNDVYLTKINKKGKEQWFRTYGGFFNDYGRKIAPSEDPDGGYLITGEKQHCLKENVSEQCYMKPLLIKVNEVGDNLFDNY